MKLQTLLMMGVMSAACSTLAQSKCSRAIGGNRKAFPPSYTQLIENRVNEALALVQKASDYQFLKDLQVDFPATKDGLLGNMYEQGLILHDRLDQLTSDKVIMSRLLEKMAGARFREFNPRGLGLKEYLFNSGILNASGAVAKSKTEILLQLRRDFPDGLVIKNVEDARSRGDRIHHDVEKIAQLIAAADPALFTQEELFQPAIGGLSNEIQSGERLFIMDKIAHSIISEGPVPEAKAKEFRVHIIDGQVVPGALVSRWYLKVPEDVIQSVAGQVQQFLDLLPRGFKAKQGYSMDVMLLPGGRIQIVEINTNRGVANTWSGFMRYPEILGAHVRFLEKNYGWHFVGAKGEVFRNDLANLRQAVKFRFKEKIAAMKNKKMTWDEALSDLKTDLTKYMRPAVDFVQAHPETAVAMKQDLKFAKKYLELLTPVQSVGDVAWNTFAKWMQEEVSGEVDVRL